MDYFDWPLYTFNKEISMVLLMVLLTQGTIDTVCFHIIIFIFKLPKI